MSAREFANIIGRDQFVFTVTFLRPDDVRQSIQIDRLKTLDDTFGNGLWLNARGDALGDKVWIPPSRIISVSIDKRELPED